MLTLSERPRRLNDFVGHDTIVSGIKLMSKDVSFPQAMIMKGETGTGKTSLALIIAATLNCHELILNDEGYYDPCLECPSCQTITQNNRGRDVYFLDGSAMGKDDILDLHRQAHIRPRFDKNKVFIIDEAQALSKAGSVAVDTLVETHWQNVYFILCTMDKNAIKKDLGSRCRTFTFNKVSDEVIAQHLFNMLRKHDLVESVPSAFIEQGLFLIAEAAEGSVRQGLQYLDRCITNQLYELDDIHTAFDITLSSTVLRQLQYALDKDQKFFEGIDRNSFDGYYRYSFKLIVEAKVFAVSKYVDADWKQQNYEKLIQHPNFNGLYSVYQKYIENRSMGYADKVDIDLFFFYMVEYFSKPSIRQRLPVK